MSSNSPEDWLRDFRRDNLVGNSLIRKLSKYLYHSQYQVIKNIARLDKQRQRRSGIEEVILAEGKNSDHLFEIIKSFFDPKPASSPKKIKNLAASLLITRLVSESFEKLKLDYEVEFNKKLPLIYHPQARIAHTLLPASQKIKSKSLKRTNKKQVAILTAGTSDFSVAEECNIVLQYWGIRTEKFYDVGVAGLDRLLGVIEKVSQYRVVIVIAGMEAALASVVGGLVKTPVIAVPTSVGYGSHFEGISSLLGMLNSCSPGIVVVNIDNGFGAASAARKILTA